MVHTRAGACDKNACMLAPCADNQTRHTHIDQKEASQRGSKHCMRYPVSAILHLECLHKLNAPFERNLQFCICHAHCRVLWAVTMLMHLRFLQENPELLNIYLPASATHLATLLLAATSSTRRRQLATAEKHLRQANTLLGCCRCLPSSAAQVALQLAQVLRLQAALKLPATDLVVATASALPGQAPEVASAAAGTAGYAIRRSAKAADVEEEVKLLPAGASGRVLCRTDLQLQRLKEAAGLLGRALQLLVHEAGSPPALVRTALLELAAVLLYQHQLAGPTGAAATPVAGSAAGATAIAAVTDRARIAAALQAAHTTAAQLRMLHVTNHLLSPVSVNGLPAWLVEQLKGQEQLQMSLQQQTSQAAAAAATAAGKPSSGHKLQHQQHLTLSAAAPAAVAAAAAAIPDATLGRLAVCHYVRQLAAASEGLAGLQQRQTAAAQAALMQAALKAACTKLATDTCWSDVRPVGPVGAGAAAAHGADAGGVPVGECCFSLPALLHKVQALCN